MQLFDELRKNVHIMVSLFWQHYDYNKVLSFPDVDNIINDTNFNIVFTTEIAHAGDKKCGIKNLTKCLKIQTDLINYYDTNNDLLEDEKFCLNM